MTNRTEDLLRRICENTPWLWLFQTTQCHG